MVRKLTPIVLAVAVTVLAGVLLWSAFGGVAPTPRPAIGGAFNLVDQTGRPVDQTLLNGKWSAVFFGYTYCPDVCPTTLQTLGAAKRELGADQSKFQIVFITVDPLRDTPRQLKDYLSSSAFAPGVIGLTGTPDQIASIAKRYGVYFQKQGVGDAYSVDHSAAIYLMDPHGRFDSVVPFGLDPQQTRDRLIHAMSAG